MSRKTIKFVIIITVIFAYYAIFISFCKAIGQATKPINIENALRGQEYDQSVIIVNTENKQVTVDVSARGAIAGWTNFYAKSEMRIATTTCNIPSGEKLTLTAIFRIPDDAANGKYAGSIAVFQRAGESTEATSTVVAQEVLREVNIVVSDKELIDLTVSAIPESYETYPGRDLPVRLIYGNTGNVAISPQVQIRIVRDEEILSNVILPYPEGLSAIKPGASQEISDVKLATEKLAGGKYVAKMDFLINGQPKASDSFSFSVNENQARQIAGMQLGSWAEMGSVRQSAIPAVAAIMLAIIVFWIIKRKNKHNINTEKK